MYTISRKNNHRRSQYNIYSVQEATDQGVLIVPWRESKVGDWAETDDAYVAECLAMRLYTQKSGSIILYRRFPFAKVWHLPNVRLEFKPSIPFIVDGKLLRNKSWVEYEAKQTRTKRLITMYVKQLMSGKVDFNELGIMYRPDQKIPAATVKRLFRQERIKDLIDQEIESTLKREGIDEKYVIDLVKKAVKMAEDGKYQRPAILLEAARLFKEMLDDKQKPGQLKAFEFGITREIMDSVDKADQEIKVLKEAESAPQSE